MYQTHFAPLLSLFSYFFYCILGTISAGIICSYFAIFWFLKILPLPGWNPVATPVVTQRWNTIWFWYWFCLMLHVILRFVYLLWFIIKKRASDRKPFDPLKRSVSWRVGPKSVDPIIFPRNYGLGLLENTYPYECRVYLFLLTKQT